MAGFDKNIGGSENMGVDDRFNLVVSVSNNSHGEVTVKSIRAEQSHNDTVRYRVDSSFRKFEGASLPSRREALSTFGRRPWRFASRFCSRATARPWRT